MKRLVIELDDKTHKNLKQRALDTNKSMREIVTSLLVKRLKK